MLDISTNNAITESQQLDITTNLPTTGPSTQSENSTSVNAIWTKGSTKRNLLTTVSPTVSQTTSPGEQTEGSTTPTTQTTESPTVPQTSYPKEQTEKLNNTNRSDNWLYHCFTDQSPKVKTRDSKTYATLSTDSTPLYQHKVQKHPIYLYLRQQC